MLYGLEDKIEEFKKMNAAGRLKQSYLFFGESQLGKFSFARNLANFLENGEFAFPAKPLLDAEIFAPEENGSIGIGTIRRLKEFLYRRPVASSRRVAIFDSAECLTPEAQNCLLKIVEEPPDFSLIIFVAPEIAVFPLTLVSRLIKIYFSRLSQKAVRKILEEKMSLDAAAAAKIAEQSFGRIGRAIQLSGDAAEKNVDGEDAVSVIDELEAAILDLRRSLFRNSEKLAWLLERLEFLKRYNLNPRLQFRAIREKIIR